MKTIIINDTIMKYENKEKTSDLCGNPCGKKIMGRGENFIMNMGKKIEYNIIEK